MAQGDYDCIIIGSGVAGLTCAAYLSRAGLKTILFEKNENLGGVAGSFAFNGYTFDVGGTPQYDQLQLLKEFEVDNLVEYRPMGEPSISMYFPGFSICGPKDIEDFLAQYEKVCKPESLRELKEILVACSEIDMSKYLKLNQAISESKTRFLIGLLKSNPIELMKVFKLITQNTGSWLKKRTTNKEILNTLYYYNGLTMLSPTDRTPALIFVLIMCGLVGKLGGRWQVVQGGNGTFFTALQAAIEQKGGMVKTGNRVKKIIIENGEAQSVILEGGEVFRAKHIISNIGIKGTVKDLVGRELFNLNYLKGIEDLRPSPSLFKVHLGINKRPEINSVLNFVVGRMEETSWWGAIEQGYIPEKTPLMFWCKFLVDSSRAPEGRYDIEILTAAPYRHRDGDWDTIKKRKEIMLSRWWKR